ncbi:rhomboid family intramembrane serine protease [Moraxella cuniculi]|uniref:Intramembrane serine protease GlpG n=1 Tax=Moraxella cuniculi TaxID=34061 RepID=A0A448GYS1_9GAMM|nr:rhomboid family intramembrane serine protease [Moraxella cuniculi]VEG13984.1 intramembrane serine protease GlpG [Moraxella cuniculi]
MNHTTAIIIITVIISIAAWQSRPLLERLIFYPPAVQRGQYDRLLTHGFIHANGMHLLFNMFTLYFFGRAIERFYIDKFGSLGFVAFYVLAIVVAIIPSYLRHKNNARYRSLGASGAVSAVLFAYILFAPWSTLYLFAIVPIPAIVFAIAYVGYSIWADRQHGGSINHSAHLFGAVFGVVATIIIEPSIVLYFIEKLLNPAF